MDLSSENPLVKAVIDKFLLDFRKAGILRGGIGLDNAGKVPQEFLEILARRMKGNGLGIAANGCPDKFLHYIDFFGNEGFPFTIDYARQARQRGFNGILGEFTMQHLSSGELSDYLKNKLFNDIVFFGYTNGGTAAGARYSAYYLRPDVYDHQRWVFRKIIPVSRALHLSGRQADTAAKLALAVVQRKDAQVVPLAVGVNAEGKVKEAKRPEEGINRITGRSNDTEPLIVRFGNRVDRGIYFFVDSGKAEEVLVDAQQLNLPEDVVVFDEFRVQVLPAQRSLASLTFKTLEGPSVVQVAKVHTLVKNILGRVAASLRLQLVQRGLDREMGIRFPFKAWSKFCQGGKWDTAVVHTGKGSFSVKGGTYTGSLPKWKYDNRQGAAQFVTLNQSVPQPLTLRAYSKAEDVIASKTTDLNVLSERKKHFDARVGNLYCMHLYMDYQDGQWPEVHSVAFSPGSHDWEEKVIHVAPSRPVKSALVLLEFHQPQGAAWFDDVSLVSGESTEMNLLAAPGFEESDEKATAAATISPTYEERVQSLVRSMENILKGEVHQENLSALSAMVGDLRRLLADKGISAYYPRENRDIQEAEEKIALCLRLLSVSQQTENRGPFPENYGEQK
jgi:hypothetical protein